MRAITQHGAWKVQHLSSQLRSKAHMPALCCNPSCQQAPVGPTLAFCNNTCKNSSWTSALILLQDVLHALNLLQAWHARLLTVHTSSAPRSCRLAASGAWCCPHPSFAVICLRISKYECAHTLALCHKFLGKRSKACNKPRQELGGLLGKSVRRGAFSGSLAMRQPPAWFL